MSTDKKRGHDVEAKGDLSQKIAVGSVFTETDTGERYVWTGSWPWVRQEQTIETMLDDLTNVNLQILQTLKTIQRGHEEYLWHEEVDEVEL